ncbi:uncharacterized protein NECHADRAFT_88513 [Fusarium vanettenii 77-13-4]|uniref:Uncharacterized protein n=1 Tax=Fusarium vanettenii (strain ATCC MYA-4622 / CBS 123669 / FGSC 9596 / NRRL 45880 / 77-13-4) TaxID=660122 RepID=C7ZBS6_FUSV7|nr:uncharacterized protein NECHADRAFT_88513 [Fusarium vanettenii 77-13-4]EEU38569.1 hypothetical protein NECHADRAFT_88513 [Fusarium vanettenii 77-13-4]
MDDLAVTSHEREINTLGQNQAIEERRYLVKKCREKLAAHIKKRTGITIEPSKVRLVTKQSDMYTWVYTAEVAHLFSKNLSEHGLTAHKELCREVGQSFHAITFAKAAISADHPSLGIYRASTYPPASSVLSAESEAMVREELCAHTTCQLQMVQENLKAETVRRECLQKELESLSAEYEHLAQRFRQEAEKAGQSESMLYKCLQVINQVASLAEEVQQDCRSTEDPIVFPR